MLSSRSFLLPAAFLLGTLQQVLAQTSSDCNPMVNGTNVCPTDPAFSSSFDFVFNSTVNDYDALWTVTNGEIDWTTDGAYFTIKAQGDAPTIRSNFYIFGGRVELWLKTAPGQGIISSVMLLSDTLDEIDLEWLGGNETAVQTNFFGKGVNNYTWQSDFVVSGGPQNDYHNYTIDWKEESLDWYIDGAHVRSLTPEQANNTYSYPQTPCRIYIGPWAGGDPDNAPGTIAWAGGETDYDDGPFTMAMQSISVTDYSNGTAYNYTDTSGTWTSIEALNTAENSTAATKVSTGKTSTLDSDSPTIAEKFNSLSTGSKAAIAACSGAAVLGVVAYAIFYCFRQRKRGAQEAALAAKRAEEDRLEREGFEARGINPDGFSEAAPTYDAKTGMATRNVMVSDDFDADGGHNSEKFVGAQPLLRNVEGYHSPPGTPNAHEGAYADPYTDGFSPVDHSGHVHSSMYPPPSGPLPGVPDRSFSSSSQHGGQQGYFR
ncbi:unnamed protein product [Discula destructiva]